MKNHPKGLPYLFLTEMWERFGYYLMIGILFLYTTDCKRNGLCFDRATASDIYGTFIALVYVTPFIGGMIADRWLGFRVSIIIGGIMMGLGYLMLALPGMAAFYGGLGLIICGNGLFKPNMSVILGNLYNEERYLTLKDTGYNIFYMGINIGAFICNFFAAYLRNTFSWGHAFAAAGIGMFIGVAVFGSAWKKLAHADVQKPQVAGEAGLGVVLTSVMLPAILTGIAGWMLPGNVLGSDSTDAFIFGSLPIIGFFLYTLYKAPAEEKRPIKALLSIYAVVIMFWAVFKQNGTALTTWAEYYTDRNVPAAVEGPAKAIGMIQEIPTTLDSFPVYDNQFRPQKNAAGKVDKQPGQHPYLLNAKGMVVTPGEPIKTVSTEIFQSVNPGWVLILTTPLVLFYAWLRRRGKEPTTPAKIGWGLLLTTLSCFVMVWAVYACHNGLEKASSWWIIATYGVITLGELCLSPMGLSIVSKLAPTRIVGLMMGGWMLAISVGNKLSGVLATMWDGYANKANFFLLNAVLLAVATAALFMMLRWLNEIFREKGLH